MAIDRSARYPGRFDVPTLAQPQGAFKNKTGPAAVDGTYLEKDWANDFAGFFSSMLQGVSANGSVDEVGASQYYDAMLNSQTYTGIPRAPTAAQGTSTTQIATTAFVDNAAEVVSGDNANGYYRIRTADGYIEQWGRKDPISNSQDVPFPVAFADAATVSVVATFGDANHIGGADVAMTIPPETTTTKFRAGLTNTGVNGFYWMARGY